jgi:hypothetical protein
MPKPIRIFFLKSFKVFLNSLNLGLIVASQVFVILICKDL